MSSLIDKLDDLCRDINTQVQNINVGGCAVFAALLGQRLQQYGDVAIAVGSDESEVSSLDDLRHTIDPTVLNEWNENGVYFHHIVVEFTFEGVKYHIDSSGVHEARSTTHLGNNWILDGRLTVDETVALSASPGWCPRFKRSQIPSMQQMIDNGFMKLINMV